MIAWSSTRTWQAATALVLTLIVAFVTAGAVYLAAGNNDLRVELRAERADSRAATANAQKLYEQLVGEGIKPEAEKPAEVEAAPGQNGDTGPRGFTGDSGPRGDIGATGVAGMLGAVGPVGSTGLSGQDGMTGASGADGSDGAPGADGAPGPKGDTGAAGADGEPAASYTIAGPGGEQTCTRTEPFDKAAPTYECALTPIKETTP